MLTSLVLKLVGGFFTFLLASMFFGNALLLYFSFVPLLIAVFALVFDKPNGLTVERKEKESRVSTWVNKNVEMSGTVQVEKGVGIVTVEDPLPEHFELVEGDNFRVFWKGFRSLSDTFQYSIKCTKRGVYRIGPSNYECRHFSGFKQTKVNSYANDVELVVTPKPLNIRRMRDPRIFSRIPVPLGSITKLGMMTTDFREIRKYSPSDPYRYINWKATARLTGRIHPWPLVNEFDREGKKVVWIFLDASSSMAIGTNVENAFEYAVQTVLGLTQFYLARNCHIGLYVYNDGGKFLPPDTGRRQEYKIAKEILGLEVSSNTCKEKTERPKLEKISEPLKKAVKKCRGHLLGTNPYSIIITMVRKENLQELIDGVKELQKYSKKTSKQPQILVIHVMGYSIAAKGFYDNVGAVLLEMRNQPAIKALRRVGAFVIPWNPTRRSLTSLMILGVKKK